jgi:hypothetical protein
MSFLESHEALAPSGIGKSVPRREDARLLTGKGRYAADFDLPGQVFAYVLRSPNAHLHPPQRLFPLRQIWPRGSLRRK